MGMFDSLMVKVVCPYCGADDVVEIQTKDTDAQCLNLYSPGDVVDEDKVLRRLRGTAMCRSPKCKKDAADEDMRERGYVSGFSKCWEVVVDVDAEGRLTDHVSPDHVSPDQGETLHCPGCTTAHARIARLRPLIDRLDDLIVGLGARSRDDASTRDLLAANRLVSEARAALDGTGAAPPGENAASLWKRAHDLVHYFSHHATQTNAQRLALVDDLIDLCNEADKPILDTLAPPPGQGEEQKR
jgi:hypothetical protein